jgi:hypothetical protein
MRKDTRVAGDSENSSLNGETFAGAAFTAELLLHLLVRTNLKQRCKSVWPDFSRLSHRSFVPDYPWQYCCAKATKGTDQTRIYRPSYQWGALREEAFANQDLGIPEELVTRPWLLALWWQVAPHRCTTAASHAFVAGVLPSWGT